MNRKACFLAAAFLLLPSIGCSRGGEEFVGRWFAVEMGYAVDWVINSNGTAVRWWEVGGKATRVKYTWAVKNGSLQLHEGARLRFVAMPPSGDTLIIERVENEYGLPPSRLRRAAAIPAPTPEERYELWEKESAVRSNERQRLENQRRLDDAMRKLRRGL